MYFKNELGFVHHFRLFYSLLKFLGSNSYSSYCYCRLLSHNLHAFYLERVAKPIGVAKISIDKPMQALRAEIIEDGVLDMKDIDQFLCWGVPVAIKQETTMLVRECMEVVRQKPAITIRRGNRPEKRKHTVKQI